MAEGGTKEKSCFVICPIGAEGSDTRRWSDDIFENLIAPTAAEHGYKAYRTIDDALPGEITRQVVQELFEADLVVADLTGNNPNVLYELALRHLTAKPFIHLSKDNSKIPFDVSLVSVVQINRGSFEGIDRTKEELRKHFEAVVNGTASFDNPAARYRDLVTIDAEGTPEAKQVVELQEHVNRLERAVQSLERVVQSQLSQTTMDPEKLRAYVSDLSERTGINYFSSDAVATSVAEYLARSTAALEQLTRDAAEKNEDGNVDE